MYTWLLMHFGYLLIYLELSEKKPKCLITALWCWGFVFLYRKDIVLKYWLCSQIVLGPRPQGAGELPLTVDCLKWQWEGLWADSLVWNVKGAHSSNFKSMQNTFPWGCFISADVSLGATPTSAFWPKVTGTRTSVVHTSTRPGQGDSFSCADDSGYWTTRTGFWCRVT